MSPSASTKPTQEPRAAAKPRCSAAPLPWLIRQSTTRTPVIPSRLRSEPSVEPSETAMTSNATFASARERTRRSTVGRSAAPGL